MSPPFPFARRKWQFCLQPKMPDTPSSGGSGTTSTSGCSHIGVFLHVLGDQPKNIRGEFTLLVSAGQSRVVAQRSSTVVQLEQFVTGLGWKEFVSREDFMQQTSKHPNVVVEAEITIFEDVLEHVVDIAPFEEKAAVEHFNVMRRLLDQSFHTDITFVCRDGARVSAHKCILAAASPVLSKLFETKMKESLEGEVELEVSKDVFVQLLRFLYTGKCEVEGVDPAALFGLAHQYDIVSLQDLCAAKMASRVAVNNAAEWLVLAHTYEQGLLKESCLSYIHSHLQEVLASAGFEQLKSKCPSLGFSILEGMVLKGDRKRKRDE